MRHKVIAGNWKMHKNAQETVAFFKRFSKQYANR